MNTDQGKQELFFSMMYEVTVKLRLRMWSKGNTNIKTTILKLFKETPEEVHFLIHKGMREREHLTQIKKFTFKNSAQVFGAIHNILKSRMGLNMYNIYPQKQETESLWWELTFKTNKMKNNCNTTQKKPKIPST